MQNTLIQKPYKCKQSRVAGQKLYTLNTYQRERKKREKKKRNKIEIKSKIPTVNNYTYNIHDLS